MDSNSISDILANNPSTAPYFLGVCGSDNMIYSDILPYCFVANVDRSNQKGSHWTAWFVDKKRAVSFLDSYGRSPRDSMFPIEYRDYVRNNRFRFNPKILETISGITCGHFCIFMIYFKCLGVDLKHIYNFFGKNLRYNDHLVYKFVKKLQNL